jgi:hypothetical protein
MEVYPWIREGSDPVGIWPTIAKQVGHGRGWRAELRATKRQATHRTNMLLELTRDSTFNRPVARVMRTRRKLIDNNAISGDEHFDAHHTDDIQAVQDTLSKGCCACL